MRESCQKKLLSVECVKNHSFLRYHSPYASPVYALLSQYDRPTVSTELCVKRQKARRVCTNNEPINNEPINIYFMISIRTSTSPCATLSSQRLPLTIHVNKNQKTKSAIYICARNKSPVSTLSFIMLLLHSRVHSRTLLLSPILSATLCLSLTLTRVRKSRLEQSRLTTSERADSVASAPV